MSGIGKISFLLSVLSLIILIGLRFVIGGWTNMLWFPFVLFLVTFVSGVFAERRLIVDFFTMKTTKNGMSLGALIIMVLVFVAALNYVASTQNKVFDMTEEKINSLSPQSEEVLKGLEDSLKIFVFYRGERNQSVPPGLASLFDRYERASNQVEVRYVDKYQRPDLAEKYLDSSDQSKDQLIIFVDHKGKFFRVSESSNFEEAITQSIVRATRKSAKKIYFISGHGEREYGESGVEAIYELKSNLESLAFEVADLSLSTKLEIPDDAAVIALVGPKGQLLQKEQELLLDYVRGGGHMLVAVDPGQSHGLADFIKRLGAEFKDNYILDPNSPLGPAVVVGNQYDRAHPLTEKFDGRTTLFRLASQIAKHEDAPEGLTVKEVLLSQPGSVITTDLSKRRYTESDSYPFGVVVEGKWDPESVKESSVVLLGDSDFLTDQLFYTLSNRDFALNIFAYLAKEKDLISIRPKSPKSSTLRLTSAQRLGINSAGLALPVVFVILSGVLWYRRRSS
ncbi:MAG: hypothetical protein CL675_04525 [Bdellovibrionaceae bacterium]|nr:hypothetical protein [Pseudobdellovibrionaceae bacterium]